MRSIKPRLVCIACFFACLTVKAQDSSKVDKLISFPDKLFSALDKKASGIEGKLSRQTDKYLNRLQKQEHRLRKKMWKSDSTLAKQMFDGIDEKYKKLRASTGKMNKYTAAYSGHLDSLTTALLFVKGKDIAGNPQLQKTLQQYQALQSKFNASNKVREYITQRKEMLKHQFERLGMVKQMKKFRQKAYYYEAQVKEYKAMLDDPSKAEQKLLSLVTRLPQFKDFFARNSVLGRMFPLPGSANTSALVTGLQTRQAMMQSLAARFGPRNNINQQLQQNVQNAEGQLNQLKSRLSSYGTGSYGNGDPDMPDFKPNSQKTKGFLKRLELGSNIQTVRARYFFPVTTDLGFSVGYKLNDKSVIGIGGSYKLGLGRGWNDIKLTHQGIGLRSYIDWKLKGQFYVSGGYEQNYLNVIHSFDQIKNISAWRSSGLIGLTRKYKLNKKFKGEVKLLWDFLSYRQVPASQPLVFRFGYSLK